MHVLATAVELNKKAACRAVVVTALNAAARAWWERLGFHQFGPGEPDELDLYLLTSEIAEEVISSVASVRSARSRSARSLLSKAAMYWSRNARAFRLGGLREFVACGMTCSSRARARWSALLTARAADLRAPL